MLVRELLGKRKQAHEVAAALVCDPRAHAPGCMLSYAGAGADELASLEAGWRARLSEPPTPQPRRSASESDGDQRRGERRGVRQGAGPKQPDSAARSAPQPHTLIKQLAEVPDGAEQKALSLVRELVRCHSDPVAELVPWLGKNAQELVLEARRRARPPGPQRVTCSLPQLRVGSRRVSQAAELARSSGAALLTATVEPTERELAVTAVGTLIKEVGDGVLMRLLCTVPVRREGQAGPLTRLEVLVLPEDAR